MVSGHDPRRPPAPPLPGAATPVITPVPAARIVFGDDDRAEVLRLVDASLRCGSLTLGELGASFEHDFAVRHLAPHAVAVASGTAALEIVLRAVGAGGADVVVPANTFFATAAAVVHAGGTPRFADVDRSTFALTADTVDAAITPATKVVVMVHIGGVISPEVTAVADLCARRGLILVEDAAHAHGADLGGRPAGSWGRAAAWSFYPTKVVTSGEGGMVTTADADLAAEARIYRDQGKAGFLSGSHVRMGAAWRMSELHAAVGAVHLRRLDEFVAVRRAVAARYSEALAGMAAVEVPALPVNVASNYYKYPVLLRPGTDRAALKARLAGEHHVSLSGEVYATPLHREPVFADLWERALPAAEDVCARQVCLPVHSDMSLEEADRVVAALRAALGDR